jgi:hypothetical protein
MDWNTLGLGVVYTQLNDDDQDFVVPYVNQSNNKIETKYNSCMKGTFIVVWVVSSF